MTADKRGTAVPRKRSRATTDQENPSRPGAGDRRFQPSSHSTTQRVSPDTHRQLVYGTSVLVVAIVVGVLWNAFDLSTDPRVLLFWSTTCRVAKCPRYVTPIRRTLQAARPMRVGEIVAEIPRSIQIWDIDALRDDFIQTQLLSARHDNTGNRLSSGAFLAAYLALRHQHYTNTREDDHADNTTVVLEVDNDDPLPKVYFHLLPTWEELSDHPLTWSIEVLVDMLGRGSLSFGVALAHHEMVDSEYRALTRVSPTFASQINATTYRLARLWVMTRSFNPGPRAVQNELVDEDERHLFTSNVVTDFTKGCHAMVPILDLLNHHPSPNVAYSYNPDTRSFVITAQRAIPAGFEIYDSYGKFSDSHLFAKFGFVNGDGSGYTQASIAPFHRMLDYQIGGEFSHLSEATLPFIAESQRSGLLRYLQYDDGYVDCISGPEDGEAWTLKELKYQHLVQMANNASRWILTVGPRHPHSKPVESSQLSIMEDAPDFDVRTLRLSIQPLMETCRLLSLIHTDYNGQAISLLQENLQNQQFVLARDSDALEYRAFMCLGRLAQSSLLTFEPRTVMEQKEHVAQLNRDAFGTRNWTTAHVRLGEMQTLQVLSGVAFGQLKQWQDQLPDPIPPEYNLRGRSCPKESVAALGMHSLHQSTK